MQQHRQRQSCRAGHWLLATSTVVLAACSDGPTAVREPLRQPAASVGGCGGGVAVQATRPTGVSANVQSVNANWGTLSTVTVTAQFNSALGWLKSYMNFPRYYGSELAPCLNDGAVTYVVDEVQAAIYTPIDPPPGVDPGFWNSLSPREQRALMAKARELSEMYPVSYPTVGDAITKYLQKKLAAAKLYAKLRAADFITQLEEREQLAGGIYGCELYRTFAADPQWVLPNDVTFTFVVDLVTAFAEAQFVGSPLRGLQFGRNATFGAGLSRYDYTTDCGRLAFNSISGNSIKVTDPTTTVTPPPGGGGGGGGGANPYEY